jgi:hypothetical protein
MTTSARQPQGSATTPPETDTSMLTAPASATARRRPVAWTKLAWVTWRQHRLMLAGVAALLGAFSLYMLIYGLKIHSAWARYVSCHPASSGACQQLRDAFENYWGGSRGSVITSGGAQEISVLLLVVPVLIGVFAGAPLLARELETGTFRFAWTQGAGRLRWTITKLVLLAVVLTAAAGAFSLLFSWYYQPFLADGRTYEFLPILFDLRGVDFAAWTLIAFAISAFAGAVIRRTVPAMAASLAAWTVLIVVTMLALRPHYEAPLTSKGSGPAGSAWVLNAIISSPGGNGVSPPKGNSGFVNPLHGVFSYQPQSRFWTFQFIEGSWLLVLALLLGAATIWLVRRRAQ